MRGCKEAIALLRARINLISRGLTRIRREYARRLTDIEKHLAKRERDISCLEKQNVQQQTEINELKSIHYKLLKQKGEQAAVKMKLPITNKRARHPDQPLINSGNAVHFKENRIIVYIKAVAASNGVTLNTLADIPFPKEDWIQFYQLIGTTLGSFADLDHVDDETYNRCMAQPVHLEDPK